MESSSTDTQQKVSRGYVERQLDYWSRMDCIDCELSGFSLKYPSVVELNDALGVNSRYVKDSLYLLRKSLTNDT